MQWQQNYGIWNDWYQKLPYSTAYVVIYIYIYIDYVMAFRLEHEDWSIISPMVLAHSPAY